MRAAVETKLREVQAAMSDLLQRIDAADAATTEELRTANKRLAGIAFTITRLLCLDDVERAYELVNGDTVDGEVLGLTA